MDQNWLEQERLKQERLEAIRKENLLRREQDMNRKMIERENDKNRKLAELNQIRQQRIDNPIQIECPRCCGKREYDRRKGIIKCPFCRGEEELIEAHRYRRELDGLIVPAYSPPPPPPVYRRQPVYQNMRYNANVQKKSGGGDTALWVILLVLGFCCCFPIPVTILTARSKMSDGIKVFLIVSTWCVFLLMGMVAMYMPDSSDVPQSAMIETPFSSEEIEDENYEEIVDQLKRAGFVNVTAQPMEDLVIGVVKKENAIDKVEINGKDSFDKYEQFRADVSIKVFYHSYPIKNENTSDTGETSTDIAEQTDLVDETTTEVSEE